MLTAYVDESARRRPEGCVYTMAALVVDERGGEVVAATMQALSPGQARVHWRIERPERRPLIVEKLAALPFSSVVAVCLHGSDLKSERARRYCLDRLLSDLSSRGVDLVIAESRGQTQDRRDLAVVTAMRRAGTLRPAMHVTWAQPSAHPQLWAVDCVAGVVTWWMGGDDRFFKVLEHRVTVLDVDVP